MFSSLKRILLAPENIHYIMRVGAWMLKTTSCFSALPAGSTPGPLGAAAEANLTVFPGRCLSVHRAVKGVRLQASLE